MEYSKANKTLVLTLLEYYKTNQSKEFYDLISKLKINDNNKEIIITNPDTINSRITDYYKKKFE